MGGHYLEPKVNKGATNKTPLIQSIKVNGNTLGSSNTAVFASLHDWGLGWGVNSLRKEFAPLGANFCL